MSINVNISKNIKLLYIEDDQNIRDVFYKMLALFFDTIEVAKDGREGFEKYQEGEFDLILSDINMPKLNGIEMAKKIREKDLQVSIAFISACDDREAFIQASQLDISGYLMKPLDINDLVPILNNVARKIEFYRTIKKHETQLIEINNDLEQQVISRISETYALNQELIETQKEVIFTMGAIGESRSKETGNHVKRVACYSKLLAKYYGLDKEKVELLKEASPMHDIGKVAIPDNILNKISPLTYLEREVMKNHALLGYEMLKHSNRPLLKMASTIAYEHHERYDGTGYPRGLKGEEISIYGRITALADVFDALGSDRCYKKAWKDEEILTMIKEERGKQFDPNLVDIFFQYIDDFCEIREKYKDCLE